MPYKDPEKNREAKRLWAKNDRANSDRSNASKTKRRVEIRTMIREYKKSHPCVVCGESDYRCLDFHHRSEKELEVSRMVNFTHSESRIMDEIEKCDVVCANCHRKLHIEFV